MKRLSLLLALSFVLLSFGLAHAIHFDVSIDPSSTFYNPVFDGTFYKAGFPVVMEVKMQNDDAVPMPPASVSDSLMDWCGYSMTVRLFGTQGGVEVALPITYNNASGGFPHQGMVRMNGWETGSAVWSSKNEYVIAEGPVMVMPYATVLPDTINHTTIGCIGDPPAFPGGWVPYGWNEDPPYSGTWVSQYPSTSGDWMGDQDLLTRFAFHFTVPLVEPDTASVCIDQSNWKEPSRDWLFSPAQDFGGPYCFEFSYIPNLPPEIDTDVSALSTPHHVAFDVTYPIIDNEGDPATGVGARDESDNPLGTATKVGSSIHWVFDPPCSWVTDGLSHVVKLYAEDNVNGQVWPNVTVHTISLTVTNSAPDIAGDCGGSFVAGINQTKFANFTATDANTGDTKTWSYTVAPSAPAGSVDLTAGVLTFTPLAADDGTTYTFTVRVTDCAGAYDECSVSFEVISQLPFFIEIELEDGNNDGPKGVIDGPGVFLGHHAYVDVLQVQGSEHNLGFDFLIAYDNSALAFMGAYGNPDLFGIPGDYEWEYFTYRFVDNCGGSCPSGLLEVVAIADQNDGAHNAKETILPEDFVLFTMDFMVSNDYTLECSFVPISFYWRDCTDNSIAMNFRSDDPLHVLQAISDKVHGFTGSGYLDITDPFYGFPTYYGAQDECYDPQAEPKTAIPFIEFFNGGIKIICSDDIDARGDINLNGIPNEIADAVVFTNYFIFGMSAFTINDEGQKAATDVNADGIPLSVADLVYLIRIVVGDVLPIPKLSPYTTEANFGHSGVMVTVDAELGAALFVFEGNVDVTLADGAANMDLRTGVVNGNTHALVYSFDKGATFTGNVLNTEGKLLTVEAADYNGSAYKTVMLPTTFTVKNFPNPFNAATTIEMALPVATNWNLTIYNVAGQRVEEFSGYSEAGMNNVIWDASAVASGIYFYKVTTDQGSLTKKMVLLK